MRLLAVAVLVLLLVAGLFGGAVASASHNGPDFWMHCTSIPVVCEEEAVPTVTITVTEGEEPPPPADTQRPAKPILSLGPVTQTSMTLSWQTGVDNVGVDHYNVYLDGVKLDETQALTWTYTGLTCGTSYLQGLTVEDAAGNTSLLAEAQWGRSTLACDEPPPPPPPSEFPNAANTGPSGTLAESTGSFTITAAGTVIQNRKINGCVEVLANNVTFRNVEIRCAGGGAAYGIRYVEGHNGLLVEDSLIVCTGGQGGTSAIATTGGVTVRRSELSGCENNIWIERDALLEDNFIHSPIPYDPVTDPHTDAVQMPTPSSNITIRHNTVYGGYVNQQNFGNSAITTGLSTNVLVTNNLLAGGGHTLRCPGEIPTDFTWNNNRFSRIFVSTVGGFGPIDGNCQFHPHSGNVIHETGQPVG